MAVNYSPCAVLPVNPPEGELAASSIRIADRFVGERKGNGFAKPEVEDPYGCFLGRDLGEEGANGAREPTANDILDLLPSDPFGMGLSATFTAIADWLEDFRAESGLNLIWNRAMVFGSDNGSVCLGNGPNFGRGINRAGLLEEMDFGDGSCDGEFDSIWDVEEFLSFGDEEAHRTACPATRESGGTYESCFGGDHGGAAPHEALLLSLSYLEVQDLLSVQRVCKSLRAVVQNDVLLWRNIHIDQPLNERIMDDDLLKLTARAQGSLQSLSLVDCTRITDDGLKCVLECNPRLTKLIVPGCTRLSIGGLVNNLRMFKSIGKPGIKCLRIGGVYGVTQKHFEELKVLLNADNCRKPGVRKPRFFHCSYSLPSYDDDSPIDIEVCPRCQKLRLVYDCPVQSCQGKQSAAQQCRACTFCIARCVQCGRCINDSEYEETFCLDLLCWGCWKQLIQCQ